MIEKEQAVALSRSDNYQKFEKLLKSDVEKMKEDLINVGIEDLLRKQYIIQGIRYVLNRLNGIIQD